MTKDSILVDAETWAAELVKAPSDLRYHPPVDDDPETWRGLTRYAWVEVMAAYTVGLWWNLPGDAVAYCAAHEQPAEGDTRLPRICPECYWETDGYAEALRMARQFGRVAA